MNTPVNWTRNTIFESLRNRWPENFYDLYPGYSKPEAKNRITFFQDEEHANRTADNVIRTFNSLSNPIVAHRVIALNSITDLKHDNLGRSWSFIKEAALAFGDRELNAGKRKLLLTGQIPHAAIDWSETLRRYLIYSVDQYAEYEIVVKMPDQILDVTWQWL